MPKQKFDEMAKFWRLPVILMFCFGVAFMTSLCLPVIVERSETIPNIVNWLTLSTGAGLAVSAVWSFLTENIKRR